MSRVSEALRDAGYQTADDVVSPSDGVLFVSAEDATENAVSEHVLPHSESETHYRHDEPADVSPPQARTESVRKKAPLTISVFRKCCAAPQPPRRWLIVAVVSPVAGAAVVYNLGATRIYEARARVLVEPTAAEACRFARRRKTQGAVTISSRKSTSCAVRCQH